MNVPPILDVPSAHEEVEYAASRLGNLLREHPLCQVYLHSIMDVETDAQVRDLSEQIQTKRNAVCGRQVDPEVAADVQYLELELETVPSIQACRAAERDVRPLVQAVNALLSQSLGVDFAANARRGCQRGA